MRTLFYIVVEMITEWITGIESSGMKLWEVSRYVSVSDTVAVLLNAGIAITILVAFIAICRKLENKYAAQNNA